MSEALIDYEEVEMKKIMAELILCYIKQGFVYDENITILHSLVLERVDKEINKGEKEK